MREIIKGREIEFEKLRFFEVGLTKAKSRTLKKNGECVFGLENKGPPLSFVGGKKTLEKGKITITI